MYTLLCSHVSRPLLVAVFFAAKKAVRAVKKLDLGARLQLGLVSDSLSLVVISACAICIIVYGQCTVMHI